MKITILSVGNKPPLWCDASFKDYQNRFSGDFELNLIEITPAKRVKKTHNQAEIDKFKLTETENILKKLNPKSYVIALDVLGKQISTEKLAEKIDNLKISYQEISFIIGGADGICQNLLNKVDEKISLSKLTFPHMLVRTILAEQIYRAWSILRNHPYHRSG